MENFELIPEARRDAVHAGLKAAFGTSAIDNLQPIGGGVSGALIFRFGVRNRQHVLRIEPERIALLDRQRGFACMAVAASAGAAPPVHYADPAAGVAIMDFIPARPLSEHPGGVAGIVRALGALIATLQETPAFPAVGDYPELIGLMLLGLGKSGLFAPGQLDRHADGLARIRAALPWDLSALVSSHNDPNPRNILFDGERMWLIDWELAFRNDRLVDVAILTTELAATPELEDLLLEATFGKRPDPHLKARLSVVRLLTRLFYGCVVLDSLRGTPGMALDIDVPADTPATFRAAVNDGRLRSGAPETACAFGRMSLRAFIDGVMAPGFDDILEQVKQG